MYKRFSIEEIQTIKNEFIPHLASTMQREKIYDLKTFLKFSFQRGDDVYYFSRWNPIFRFSQNGDTYEFVDEKDKIELLLTKGTWTLPKLSTMLKKYMTKRTQKIPDKSIISILTEEFSAWHYMTVQDKPYLIYDIETNSNISNLKDTKFYLAYVMKPWWWNKMLYEYIAQDDIQKFTKKMLEFDGYIVWFNQMWFDNPVCAYSSGLGENEIKILNEKSLDLFLFVWNLTGKRIGLNKISQALVSVEKTLDVWAQWDTLRKQYQETGDMQYLNEFKKYCKNDVRMTTLVMLYMLYYKKIFIDGKEYNYSIEDFIKLAGKQREKTKKVEKAKSIFV